MSFDKQIQNATLSAEDTLINKITDSVKSLQKQIKAMKTSKQEQIAIDEKLLELSEISSASNLVANGNFNSEDTSAEHMPEFWIAEPATLGTTLKLSDIEVQTVAISGTPTGGHYTLSWSNSSGNTLTTAPLAYNATATDVQTALRNLGNGLESITVASTGTSPDA